MSQTFIKIDSLSATPQKSAVQHSRFDVIG